MYEVFACRGHRWAVQLTGGEPTTASCRDHPWDAEGFWGIEVVPTAWSSRAARAIWRRLWRRSPACIYPSTGRPGTCTRPRVGATFWT
ncbi:MAG: hypothetical protein ACLSDQ_07260 [Adlercreutzia equolifaciens]